MQVKFNAAERDAIRDTSDPTFGGNIRELMSAVFASIVWGVFDVSISDDEQADPPATDPPVIDQPAINPPAAHS